MNSKINYAVAICEPLELEHPDSFLDVQVPYPQALPHDVIVKVQAISINPADTRARRRKTKDNQITVLGWDVVGTITEIGSHVSEKFKIGDIVYYAGDISRSGGNCTYHAIDSRLIAHAPSTISIEDAAALPLVSLTAWEALAERLSLQISSTHSNSQLQNTNKSRSLLVIGGAGGVGSMAIQLAKLVPQLTVIATASRQETTNWCRKLGADHIIDHTQDIPTQLSQLAYSEVDYVLICNSPDSYFNILPSITKPFGKICNIVPFSHLQDFNLLMKKSLSFHWELMFTRCSFQTTDMAKQSEILDNIAKLVDQNIIISPRLTSLHPINAEKIKQAHQLVESNKTIGKIVVVNEKQS
ncbi:zinc-binding alcohol dehydrogenase family protein [Acinetobacter baumannii]|uniref:zinc-binding alcohol dehydrogenase family protein n=1 Tax=Acinetobacter baumannii TaxID=470 RepID=UPI003749D2BA